MSAEVHRVVWAEDLEEPPLQKTDNKICKRLMIKIKISADGDCSQQIKRCLLLGRKAMINLDSILKSGDVTADKGLSSQSYGFSSHHVWR